MKFSDFIQEENILRNLSGKNKLEVIEELLNHMHKLGVVSNYETALNDILVREKHLSTGLENGIAIPHAKTEGVEKLSIVFGIKNAGIDFDSLDAKPAKLIFLVLSPKNTSGPHIQALALISRNLSISKNRDSLNSANSANEIANIFSSFS
ncbi:MAG: PTS sugar transporter subunit IIA, partial [Calditrichia bacterium]|nr:PTS sugar transporter subunit IIA [Calditrichia bacterium]